MNNFYFCIIVICCFLTLILLQMLDDIRTGTVVMQACTHYLSTSDSNFWFVALYKLIYLMTYLISYLLQSIIQNLEPYNYCY